MREIEFKGKTKYGSWVEGYYLKKIDEEGRVKHYIIENYADLSKSSPGMKLRYNRVKPETVSQFTGIKGNLNNEKIYENDKIEWLESEYKYKLTGRVKFKNSSFVVIITPEEDERLLCDIKKGYDNQNKLKIIEEE